MFAILILGCGTETPVVEEPVVEEPEPVVEDPEPVIEEPPPVVVEAEHLMPGNVAPPQIAAASVVFDGDIDVDPEPLNRHGITLNFTEDLNLFLIEIFLEGKTLRWVPREVVTRRFAGKAIGTFATIRPTIHSQLLEYDTEYTIEMYVQGHTCNGTWIKIRFRTKPE